MFSFKLQPLKLWPPHTHIAVYFCETAKKGCLPIFFKKMLGFMYCSLFSCNSSRTMTSKCWKVAYIFEIKKCINPLFCIMSRSTSHYELPCPDSMCHSCESLWCSEFIWQAFCNNKIEMGMSCHREASLQHRYHSSGFLDNGMGLSQDTVISVSLNHYLYLLECAHSMDADVCTFAVISPYYFVG